MEHKRKTTNVIKFPNTTFRAHQIPLLVDTDHPGHLELLETWMKSYHPEELFDVQGHLKPELFNQHAKWLKICNKLPWRKDIASLNYLLSSHVWQWASNDQGSETVSDSMEPALHYRKIVLGPSAESSWHDLCRLTYIKIPKPTAMHLCKSRHN